VISKKVRRRGQRFPSGSEKTNGVSPGGTSSDICSLICLDYEEVRTRNRLVIPSENPVRLGPRNPVAPHEVFQFTRFNPRRPCRHRRSPETWPADSSHRLRRPWRNRHRRCNAAGRIECMVQCCFARRYQSDNYRPAL